MEDATRTGWHTVARLESSDASPEEIVGRSLHSKNATLTLDSTRTDSVFHLLFNFRVRLTTDERVDRVDSVLIDGRTWAERRAAPALFEERQSLPEEGASGWKAIGDGYRAACAILEGRLEQDVKEFRDEADALRKSEVERITAYFNRSIAEAFDSKMADGAGEARALELERDRRLAEAGEKYRFVGEVELCNVRTVFLDVTRVEATLSNRGARRGIALEYDCVNREVPLPVCEVCAVRAEDLVLCFGGHLAGEECVKGCEFCDRVHCRTCIARGMIVPCATCKRSLCPDHVEVCALSQKAHCPEHIHACAICGRTVGPEYVARCVSCEQSYCAVCVTPPAERCVTCRTLEGARAGDPSVAALRRSEPGLAKITKWKRASNQRVTVLLAKGLVRNHLLVVDARGTVLVRKKVLGA